MDLQTLSAIRELTPQELPQLNALVSESFGYESPHTFFDDFPIWKSSRVKRLGIFEGEKLIAHVGIRFCEFKVPDGETVPVAMVGAVATEQAFRGRGLSSKLMNEVCRISEEERCDWTILWGSEHDFYKKFGFELRGEQFQAPLGSLKNLPENKIPHVKRGWDERIFDFISQAKNGVKLSSEDRDWFASHLTVNWLYHEEPFAFIGFERGLDLPELVHEYGGEPNALKEVFSYVLSLEFNASILGNKAALTKLGFSENQLLEEYLCLARPHSKKPDLHWDPRFWVSGLNAC